MWQPFIWHRQSLNVLFQISIKHIVFEKYAQIFWNHTTGFSLDQMNVKHVKFCNCNQFGLWCFTFRYVNFRVSGEVDNYRISWSSSMNEGNKLLATDSLNGSDPILSAQQMAFSTWDRDNDLSTSNCAADAGSGWWYNDCSESNLRSWQWIDPKVLNGFELYIIKTKIIP